MNKFIELSRKKDENLWYLPKKFQLNKDLWITLVVLKGQNRPINSITSITFNFSLPNEKTIKFSTKIDNAAIINSYIDSLPASNKNEIKVRIYSILNKICFHNFPIDENITETEIDISDIQEYFDNSILIPSINVENKGRVLSSIANYISDIEVRKNVDKINIRKQIDELKKLINENCSDEKKLQNWMENNSWAFGYKTILKSRVTDKNSDHQVDAFCTNEKYCDVIEIKTAAQDLYLFEPKIDETENNFPKYWHTTKELTEALGQIIHYISDYKKNSYQNNAAKQSSKEKIFFSNPKGLLVIGTDINKFKNVDNSTEKDLIESAENDFSNFCYTLHNIEIWTWDDVLKYAEYIFSLLRQNAKEDEQ